MNKNYSDKNFQKQDKNESNDGFVAFLVIISSIFMLPVLLGYAFAPYFAEFPHLWVLLQQYRKRILIWAGTSLLALALLLKPLFAIAISHGNIAKILVVLTFWLLSVPFAVIVIRYRFQFIFPKVKQNDYDPRKIGYIRNALEVANFLSVSNKYVSEPLPLRTETGESILGRIANFDFRLKGTQFLTQHRNMELKQVKQGDYAIFPLNAKSPSHSLVLAETGAGKTVLLSRMALSALSANWKVVVLDFKGATDEANLYCSLPGLVRERNRSFAFPHQSVDLFWGDRKQVTKRLIGFLPPMPQGAGTFYWAREASAISAVVLRAYPGIDTPKSIPELLHRVRNAGQFAMDVDDRNMLLAKQNGRLVCEDVAAVLSTYFDHLKSDSSGGTPGGFSFASDFDMAFYSLNGMDINEVNLGATLISDFAFWISSLERQISDPRPVLLVIDEASALQVINGSPALTFLVQKARSLKVSVVVASQTLSSLGDSGEEILKSGCIRYLGRLSLPNDLVEATGTKSQVERSLQYTVDGGFTGTETLREQNTFTINPDVVRKLPNLSWIVTAIGMRTSIYVPWIDLQK